MLTDDEKARFDGKWAKEGDCHVWQGPLDKDGYGTFHLRRRGRRSHRVAWYAANGPIDKGMVINHTCRNRACVNVQHLQLVTLRENALRDSSSPAYVNSQKTHCREGHPFDKEVVWSGKKQRVCSICERAKHRRLRAKWRAEGSDQLAC
jgi:hypothetical protein